jgi:pilus assembly protein CpaF
MTGFGALSRSLHAELVRRMDLRRNEIESLEEREFRGLASSLLTAILKDTPLPAGCDASVIHRNVLQDCVGLGVLEDLMADDTISEIMVNGPAEIFIERKGRLQRHEREFDGRASLDGVIERLLAPTGRRVDESSPMVDARLRDGSRLNIIVPPLALAGPCITIRKFQKRRLTIEDLLANGTLSPAMAEVLVRATRSRLNIVISGGTATGKTTLLNALANLVPPGERLITIEDAAELALDRENLVTLESRPPNLEGAGRITIRDLLRNALRMRPDRIVIGECRGGEALDMLQAMNTGHSGSLTSVHANAPRDALSRLEVMSLMAGLDLPLGAVRSQIASAVDLIIQIARLHDGSRRIVDITEITGMEQGVIQSQQLFRRTPGGHFESTSLPASFLQRTEEEKVPA